MDWQGDVISLKWVSTLGQFGRLCVPCLLLSLGRMAANGAAVACTGWAITLGDQFSDGTGERGWASKESNETEQILSRSTAFQDVNRICC